MTTHGHSVELAGSISLGEIMSALSYHPRGNPQCSGSFYKNRLYQRERAAHVVDPENRES